MGLKFFLLRRNNEGHGLAHKLSFLKVQPGFPRLCSFTGQEGKKWQIDKKSWQVVNAFPKESLWEQEKWAILSEWVQLDR